MHIVSAFKYSTELELAISELEQNGIEKENIVAIPLDKRQESPRLFDTIHRSDGVSMMDLASILGMIFMLLGIIYGYKAPIGPVFLGFIGLILGFILGVSIKWVHYKKKKHPSQSSYTEVFLSIKCEEQHKETIQEILWDHRAIGIGFLS